MSDFLGQARSGTVCSLGHSVTPNAVGPNDSETVTFSSDSETDMKACMQDLFEHQEVRIQTLLQQQLDARFGVLENYLTGTGRPTTRGGGWVT